MYNYTEEVASQLNGLLEKNYDAEKGYKTAAENAKSNVLTTLFKRKAEERKRFGNELKLEIESLGVLPENDGSNKALIHRAWMDTKAFFSSNADESMLEEALRGEKASIDEYNEVINSKEFFSKSTSDILKKQRDAILSDTILIKKLEETK